MRERVELFMQLSDRSYSSKDSANSAEVIFFRLSFSTNFLVKIKRLRKRLSIKIKQASCKSVLLNFTDDFFRGFFFSCSNHKQEKKK